MWMWLYVVVGSAPLFLLAYLIYRWDKRREKAALQAYTETYEYAMSDQGIKDAAKRHAKFLKNVKEEMSIQEKKETD